MFETGYKCLIIYYLNKSNLQFKKKIDTIEIQYFENVVICSITYCVDPIKFQKVKKIIHEIENKYLKML